MAQDDASSRELEARAQYDEALAEFIAKLRKFHIGAGAPSLRELARRGKQLSPANLSEIFNGKRLPGLEATLELVRILHGFAEAEIADERVRAAQAKRQLADWREQWEKVKTLQRDADTLARQARASATRTARQILAQADREAEQIRLRAQGEADSIRLKAAADAEKVRLDTEAGVEAMRAAAHAEIAHLQHRNAARMAELTTQAQRDAAAIKAEAEALGTAPAVEQANREADVVVAAARKHASETLMEAAKCADELVAEARAQLHKATTEATRIAQDAAAGAEALRATVAEQVAMAQREAQRLRAEATAEAEAMKVSAEKAADAVVAKAREKAATIRGEAQREVEAMEIRREEVKAEMDRVQGVLNALAGPIITKRRPEAGSVEATLAGAPPPVLVRQAGESAPERGPSVTGERWPRTKGSTRRKRGTVKWFNAEKGHGFIAQDDGGPDVYVHFSALEMDGYRTLEENQRVTFKISPGPKGPQADSVRLV